MELGERETSWFESHRSNLQRVRLSVVVLDEGLDADTLRTLLAAVASQRFVEVEVCFATTGAGWPDAELRAVLGSLAVRRVVDSSGTRAALLRAALESCTGEHVLLTGSTALVPHASAGIAAALSRAPEIDLLYFDEESRGERGELSPLLKPGWSPGLLRRRNYVGSAFVARRRLLLDRLRSLHDPSRPEWKLLKSFLEDSSTRVLHLAAILGTRQTDFPAELASPAAAGPGRLQTWPRVTVVVPTRDALALLERCVDGVLHHTRYASLELLVVDNGSIEAATLGYLDQLREDARVRVLRDDGPFNFARLNNRAVAEATGELVCLLNNDIEITDQGWLEGLVGLLQEPGVGAVGPLLLYPDGRVQHAGVVTGMYGVAAHLHRGADPDSPEDNQRLLHPCEVSALTAACLLLPRPRYLAVGGMNARELAVAFNDVDLCLKLRQRGHRLLWTPEIRLVHHESMSRGDDSASHHRPRLAAEMAYMKRIWGRALATDPYFNPNLSLDSAQPVRLADRPRAQLPWRHRRATGTA